jgi:hypothetical protein
MTPSYNVTNTLSITTSFPCKFSTLHYTTTVSSQVLTAASMKTTVFWHVAV